MKALETESARAAQRLKGMRASLDDEQSSDDVCARRFGPLWSRTASAAENAPFLAAIAQYEEKLQIACTANAQVCEKLKTASSMSESLSKSRDSLDEALAGLDSTPTPHAGTHTADSPQKQKVRLAVARLDKAVFETTTKVEDFRRAISNCEASFLGKVMQAPEESSIASFEEAEVRKFDGHAAQLSTAVSQCQTTLQNARSAWSDYKSRENVPLDAKAAFMQNLEASARAVQEGFLQASEGSVFFEALRDHLAALELQIDNWLFTRRETRTDLLVHLQRRAAGARVGGRLV
eukprot:Polyplicarium_translucidae@DN2107_c0_g1_i1.p1